MDSPYGWHTAGGTRRAPFQARCSLRSEGLWFPPTPAYPSAPAREHGMPEERCPPLLPDPLITERKPPGGACDLLSRGGACRPVFSHLPRSWEARRGVLLLCRELSALCPRLFFLFSPLQGGLLQRCTLAQPPTDTHSYIALGTFLPWGRAER